MILYDEEQNKPIKEKHSISTLQCVLFFLMGCFGFQLLGTLTNTIFIAVLPEDYISSHTALVSSFINAVVYVLLLAILLTMYYFFNKQDLKDKALGFKNTVNVSYAGRWFAYYLVCNFALNIIMTLIQLAVEKSTGIILGTSNNQSGINSMISANPIMVFFVVCIIGPICEEITYRLGLFEALRRVNVKLAFILAPVLFALIHFDFEGVISGISSGNNLVLYNELFNLPSYILGGLILSYAYWKNLSINQSIYCHIFVNTLSFFSIVIQLLLQ